MVINLNLKFKNWTIEEQTGYHPITTAYMDLSIAEPFGLRAVQGTYTRLIKAFAHNHKELTELVMALNWKIWEHYRANRRLAEFYNGLWEKAAEYAETTLKGEELDYYWETID